jgi:hypothetical protein
MCGRARLLTIFAHAEDPDSRDALPDEETAKVSEREWRSRYSPTVVTDYVDRIVHGPGLRRRVPSCDNAWPAL